MVAARRTIVGACLAVLALSAIAATSASATEFVFSKTGTLKGSALTSQVMTETIKSWECTKEKLSGSATELKTKKQKVIVQYEGCGGFLGKLTATPAEYELKADGTVALLKELVLSNLICTLHYPAQTVSSIAYANKPAGKVEMSWLLTKVKSFGNKEFCVYEESLGIFEGKSVFELEGGTAEVK